MGQLNHFIGLRKIQWQTIKGFFRLVFTDIRSIVSGQRCLQPQLVANMGHGQRRPGRSQDKGNPGRRHRS